MHRIEETVDRGICIGCGACAAASGGAIELTLGATRLYQPDLAGVDEQDVRRASRVCPFSDESPNEDELGAPAGNDGIARHPVLGNYHQTFAGRIMDDDHVLGSSSGGLTSWLLKELVAEGVVDAVINVGSTGRNAAGEIFEHGVAPDDKFDRRRKSQYYATTMAEALNVVRESGERRYAIVGVPCFIRAARALAKESTLYKERLVFFASLVCGHMKTQAYAESLAWQVGVPPNELVEADFRVKVLGRQSSDYEFAARGAGEDTARRRPMSELEGGNWGHNTFQPEACNFCDDVVGETADVSFGDAWLPQFTTDSRGTNVVITRNPAIGDIFAKAQRAGEVELVEISPDEVVQSQAGGFRHRREGLAVRLADDLAAGMSVPRKRVEPSHAVTSPQRAELYRQRRRMAQLSQDLFAQAVEKGDLGIYLKGLGREVRRYRRLEPTKVRLKRGLTPLRRALRGVLGR